MTIRFTPVQAEAIRALRDDAGPTARVRMRVSDVRDALGLGPLPYAQFLAPDAWLAGGRVLRWLCGEASGAGCDGDFDLFFSSFAALNRTAAAMEAQGMRMVEYVAMPTTIEEYRRKGVRNDRTSGLWTAADRLVPITPEVVTHFRLVLLTYHSPEGHKIQLVAKEFPDLYELVSSFDLSVCRFGANDRHLYFDQCAWDDLCRRRVRVGSGEGRTATPDSTLRRLRRYARRGFWPYPSTLAQIGTAAFAWYAWKIPRYLVRRICGQIMRPGEMPRRENRNL